MRLIFLVLLVLALSACGNKELIHGLSEENVNRILYHLDSLGIEAHKIRDSQDLWRLDVAESDFSRALRALNHIKLPQAEFKEDIAGSLFMSPQQRRHHQETVISRQLERTLRDVVGVSSAKVHIHLPIETGIWKRKSKSKSSSAGILIVAEQNTPEFENRIKALISGATGIPKESVSVWTSTSSGMPGLKVSGVRADNHSLDASATGVAMPASLRLSLSSPYLWLLFSLASVPLGRFFYRKKSTIPTYSEGDL